MRHRRHAHGLHGVALLVVLALPGIPVAGDEYNLPPIAYATTPAADAVALLDRALEQGRQHLDYSERFGYLPALLAALAVPRDSQTLVFSKTSQQKEHISPDHPRSLYFNDEVYIGRVPLGDTLEIAATDPRQGMIFYVLDQQQVAHPRLVRKNDECLICHDGQTLTGGVPGLMMRSVFPDAQGQAILKAGTYLTDQCSPLALRWGGWYVTGTHGALRHLGNMTCDEAAAPAHVDREAGANRVDLKGVIDEAAYPEPGSDLVALLMLGHQTQMHNRITAAGFAVRVALAQDAAFRAALAHPTNALQESTQRSLANAGEEVLRYLLFSGEAELGQAVAGTSTFAARFSERGPRDRHGRSLFQLDLVHRLLRFPCSYLIYSEAFDALPEPLEEYISRRLAEILGGQDQSAAYAHLSAADRSAIAGILRETKPALARWWDAHGFPAGTGAWP
jgi:hypothetical protein